MHHRALHIWFKAAGGSDVHSNDPRLAHFVSLTGLPPGIDPQPCDQVLGQGGQRRRHSHLKLDTGAGSMQGHFLPNPFTTIYVPEFIGWTCTPSKQANSS